MIGQGIFQECRIFNEKKKKGKGRVESKKTKGGTEEDFVSFEAKVMSQVRKFQCE